MRVPKKIKDGLRKFSETAHPRKKITRSDSTLLQQKILAVDRSSSYHASCENAWRIDAFTIQLKKNLGHDQARGNAMSPISLHGRSAKRKLIGGNCGISGNFPGSYVCGKIGLPVRPSWIIIPTQPMTHGPVLDTRSAHTYSVATSPPQIDEIFVSSSASSFKVINLQFPRC